MKWKPLPPMSVIPIALGIDGLTVLRDHAEHVRGRLVGVVGEGDRHPAEGEGLLHPLEDGAVERGDLLGGGLAAEEAGDLRAVVPGVGAAARQGVGVEERAAAEVEVGVVDRDRRGSRRRRRRGRREKTMGLASGPSTNWLVGIGRGQVRNPRGSDPRNSRSPWGRRGWRRGRG